jgi:protein subunit release factor B
LEQRKKDKVVRKLLFSVTRDNCEWSYTRGTGNGGQSRNKTSSAVHCIHPPSGAHGYAEDQRSQLQNRQLAFERMAKTKEFQTWNRTEARRVMGIQADIEAKVDAKMRQIRIEIRNEKGLWQEVPKDAALPDDDNSRI